MPISKGARPCNYVKNVEFNPSLTPPILDYVPVLTKIIPPARTCWATRDMYEVQFPCNNSIYGIKTRNISLKDHFFQNFNKLH